MGKYMPFTLLLVMAIVGSCKDDDNQLPTESGCYPTLITYSSTTGTGTLYSFEYDENNRLLKATSGEDVFSYVYQGKQINTLSLLKNDVLIVDYQYVYNSNGSLDKLIYKDQDYLQQYVYRQGASLPVSAAFYKINAAGEAEQIDTNSKFTFDAQGNLVRDEIYQGDNWWSTNEFSYEDETPFYKWIPDFNYYYGNPLKPQWAVGNLTKHTQTRIYPFPDGEIFTTIHTYSTVYNDKGYPETITRLTTPGDKVTTYTISYKCN